jgi:hypothetical protein
MEEAVDESSLKALTPDQIQGTVRTEVENAVDWIESNISIIRQKSEAYYEGLTTLKSEKGRSSVVVSTVRDAIHSILPNIGRIFTQTDTIVEFSSDDETDEQICKEMTLFSNGVFHKYGGYVSLIHGVTDALKSRIGVVRVTLQRNEIKVLPVTRIITLDEASELMEEVQAGEVMITESAVMPQDDPAAMPMQQVTTQRKAFRNKWLLEAVAPEEVIVDANATSLENARLVGIRRNVSLYDAMALGFTYDELSDLTYDEGNMLSTERINRLGYQPSDYSSYGTNDPTARFVLISEIWIRIDTDGDGVTELRHMILGGIDYKILEDTEAKCIPLAVFLTDLQPHVFFPIALAEDLIQDQDALTAITRSIIDNVALTNSPRTEINEQVVNLEDAKNNEIGAIIRVTQMGQINELVTPFIAGQTLPVLEYLHQNSESRSGVTKLSQGIDPNALQATSRIAANAAVLGSDSRIEMMARNVAETGLKSLFEVIIRVAMYELKGTQSIKTATGYKDIHPGNWHDQINININVGLGNGRIEEKQQTLMNIAGTQQQLVQQYGLTNPLCTWENQRNTYKHLLRLSGIKNVGDYFPFVAPEQIQAFDAQLKQAAATAAQQQMPPPPDLVGAAKVKGEVDMRINDAKIQAQMQADMMKMRTEQQQLFAEMQQKHTLEMVALKTELLSKITVTAMATDQKRDAANQKYATDAYKIQMDAETQRKVAAENASNDVQVQ